MRGRKVHAEICSSPGARGALGSLARGAGGGFTLWEMLLVLTILAVVAGLSWPLLDRPYADRQLLRAGEEVRQVLASARLNAIEHGVFYRFVYEQGGRTYLVEPEAVGTSAPPAGRGGPSPAMLGTTASAGTDTRAPQVLRELPPGLVFQPGAGPVVTGFLAPPGGTWSMPVVFQPDGSAADAGFRIVDAERSKSVRLSIRGLTGTVRVGSIAAEVQP